MACAYLILLSTREQGGRVTKEHPHLVDKTLSALIDKASSSAWVSPA